RGRFLSRAVDLADPRWTLAPPGIPPAVVHPRDDLVMPDDAPAPRRQQVQEPRPRQAGPVRGKLSRCDQRRRLRMVEVGAAAHVAEERAEEQREYDRQDEPADAGHDEDQVHDDHAHHAFDQQDPSMSPSGMISFSLTAARAYASPAHAGTSSHPEYGPDHPAPFTAHTQEHIGLDELLYHMSTWYPAEFSSFASTYRMTRASHHMPRPHRRHPQQMSSMDHGFPPIHLLRLWGFQCLIRVALAPSTRLHHLIRHHPHIIASHFTGIVHHSHRRSHSRVPLIRPSQQRLLRHHSHVALPGLSDLRRVVPEVTCIPVEESIRVRIV
ncbi:hypothetical protein PIB30_101586, partial [Stylosanthes scabra]|nr:hypothetical protein [Stylosanthes scabra]